MKKKSDVKALAALAAKAMEDVKAQNIVTLDVRKLTTITDFMVIATGTSARHVRSIAQNVMDAARRGGWHTVGSEGLQEGEWVLADFGGVLVHVLSADMRRFYALEKLWSEDT